MAMLLFSVGDNRYVIDNRFILRIIPHVPLKKLPYTSNYVIGLLNFSGKPLPVIDFCQLIEQRAAKKALDSRIIILWDPDLKENHQSFVGIIGEKVITILPLTTEQFNETGFHLNQFPYLDGVYSDQEGVIQKILVPELFNYLSHEFFNFSKLGTDES
jgi:chemotaxis-related protein WspB